MTASAYRFLPDNPIAPLSMPRSQTVLIDPAGRDQATVLEVIEGVCRVYCPCEETEGMTPVSYTHLTLPTNREG